MSQERMNFRGRPPTECIFSIPRQAIGSPLLNEYGDVMGMVGGALMPGATSLDTIELVSTGSSDGRGATSVIRGGLRFQSNQFFRN